MTDAKIVAEEAITRLRAELKEHYEPYSVVDKVTVKTRPHNGHTVMFFELQINTTYDKLKQLMIAKEVTKLDPSVEVFDEIEKVSDHLSIYREVDKFPWPLTNREFIYVNFEVQEGEPGSRVFFLTTKTIEHAKYPSAATKLVRGDIFSGFVCYERGATTCSFLSFIECDPKGNIPSSLVTAGINDGAKQLVEFAKMAEK
jgi:hypothetical protein